MADTEVGYLIGVTIQSKLERSSSTNYLTYALSAANVGLSFLNNTRTS